MHKKWTAFFDLIDKITTQVGAVIMAVMSILVSYQVVARYCFHYAPPWTEETTFTLLMWVSLFAGASGVWNETHMDLAMLVERFPKTVQLWLRVFSDLLIAAFGYILLVYGISLVQQTMLGIMASLPIPYGITYLIMPISGSLMLVFSLFKAFTRIMNFYVWKDVVSSEGVSIHG
jgi:TRAP-type C4-dicarboxylate transport system permease small subunit